MTDAGVIWDAVGRTLAKIVPQLPEVAQVGDRDVTPPLTADDHDHSPLVGHTGQWTPEQILDPAQNGGDGADAEAQGQDGDGRESGAPGELPGCVAEVLQERRHGSPLFTAMPWSKPRYLGGDADTLVDNSIPW